jgi:hypothetical protein
MERDTNIDYTQSHDLSIEEVKACSIFAHMTDEDAEEIVKTLKIFTKIAYDVYKKDTENL